MSDKDKATQIVRVSPAVMEKIRSEFRPYTGDTADRVLRRLLGLPGGEPPRPGEEKPKRRRAS